MKTEVVKIQEDDVQTPEGRRLLERAGEVIKAGGLVAFPTETVYGLGGNAFDPAASARIYAAKGRPSDNPLIVHIADLDDLTGVASEVPDEAYALAERFWPGPLTIIMKKKPELPAETTGGLDTVAVRFPSHRTAQGLIKAGGGFIAAPSANLSGRPSPTAAEHCVEDLDGRVDMIIDGGRVGIGVESSIIDISGGTPDLLRPGYVTASMLVRVLGKKVEKCFGVEKADDRPRAPGMKYRHYAPRGEMVMVRGNSADVIGYINDEASGAAEKGIRTAVIASGKTAGFYTCADRVYAAGDSPEEIAGNLFGILRQLDADSMERIFTEAFDGGGELSEAVMNRLIKACGNNIVEV